MAEDRVVCPLPSISTLPARDIQSTSVPNEAPTFSAVNFEDLNFVATTVAAQPSLYLQLPIPISQFELVDQVESFMGHINHDVVFGASGSSSSQSSSEQSPNLISLDHQDSVMISLNVAKTQGIVGCEGNELHITCGNDQAMVSHGEIATMTDFMNHQLGLDGTQDVPWGGDLEEGLALSVFH